ncbi:hypothetical protein JCM15457_1664 [Liquorilactobacillus sucicola DSM 21376 = JCM 15457]|nr:hypothetical protein JCM15457_1664 [Liquorilactobacillus sucicola DSM 21376 = JCM 15457]
MCGSNQSANFLHILGMKAMIINIGKYIKETDRVCKQVFKNTPVILESAKG